MLLTNCSSWLLKWAEQTEADPGWERVLGKAEEWGGGGGGLGGSQGVSDYILRSFLQIIKARKPI